MKLFSKNNGSLTETAYGLLDSDFIEKKMEEEIVRWVIILKWKEIFFNIKKEMKNITTEGCDLALELEN